ncbi:glycosyltransferase family 2 protein [Methylobacterium sp. NEAU K]|uniref:glycosyltransferase family 2 protein n=1 Tax=Methylobacterium sp. NEAU K TaxID=3064946 RepID=UPI002734D72F|nr:glycosyltransferase family 2 protein [Methylobacterium sp. NEAU K]MDP4006244.1 glycosyltransferase family 2 protein [Methylobacterium sp. NEAU K]
MRLCICICTCERPTGLARLLEAIDQQRLGSLAETGLRILVVDNGRSDAAIPVVEAYRTDGRFPITYAREEIRGLSAVRNRSLNAAAALGSDWVALIDDDEIPDRDWLCNLLDTALRVGVAACVGPVVPFFDRVPPAWAVAGGFFAKRLPVRDGLVADAYTANALLDLRVVTALGLSFDMRFNTMGGEDTYFFRSLLLAGHRIAWAQDAVVYDSIPTHRMRVRWLLARWYRSGSVEAYLGRLRPETVSGRLANAARGLARLAGGLLRLGIAGLSLRRATLIGGGYTLCRGAGLLAAVFGASYREYHPSRHR